jgi:YHS domain-containing protein
MTVNPEDARAKGLSTTYEGREYVFCGRGCFLDFADDPKKYFDPNYVPHM